MPAPTTATSRIASLDQFRGYTVLGMMLVNFVGGFHTCHYLLRHHDTFCSYADTIMPQFFFAVGFAFRLTFVKRAQTQGLRAACERTLRRLAELLLLSLVLYSVGIPSENWRRLIDGDAWLFLREALKGNWFQTLTHIAVTSLWILPVIRAGWGVRMAFLLASAAAHLILSHTFNFAWVNNGQPDAIDGGPLGFLTWTIPTLVGTMACDVAQSGRAVLARCGVGAAVLMLIGYLLSCGTRCYDVPVGSSAAEAVAENRIASQPVWPSAAARQRTVQRWQAGAWHELLAEAPFIPPPHPPGHIERSHQFRQWNYWMMSQRGGTVSYLTFAAGFALAVYAVFYLVSDCWGGQSGILRTLGTNALAAYVLHIMVARVCGTFMSRDGPAWTMWFGCLGYLLITYLLVRALERNNVYIRL